MSQKLRDVLEVLRYELNYIEQGGFDRDRSSLGLESPFLGNLSCINFGDPLRAHACRECFLHQFVPEDKQTEDYPCHHIPLNDSGETVDELIKKKDPKQLAVVLEHWLHTTIARLEATQSRNVPQ